MFHKRTVKLIIVDRHRRPFHDTRWYWIRRKAAGWPDDGGTFHALWHFCATMLQLLSVDPQHVQTLPRQTLLQTTLAIYSHWLPRTSGHATYYVVAGEREWGTSERRAEWNKHYDDPDAPLTAAEAQTRARGYAGPQRLTHGQLAGRTAADRRLAAGSPATGNQIS